MPAKPARIRALIPSEPVVAVAVSAVVLGVAAWVSPKAIRAMQPDPPPLGEVVIEGAAPDERFAIVEGLRDLLQSSYAFVCAQTDENPAIALWQSDDHHRGRLDAGETLVLAHSPLLETITALYVDNAPPEAAIDVADVCATHPAHGLRRYGTVRPRVIATGVRALSVAPRREAPGVVELALTLTWAENEVEAQGEAGPSRTTLRVRLRLVEGVGR